MPNYAALLRGVNVGGRNLVPMADLRAAFASIGYGDARTYLQSGNVVLSAAARNEAALRRSIEHGLAEQLARPFVVLLRTHAELEAVVAGNPFREADGRRLYVMFLDAEPAADRRTGLAALTGEGEAAEIVGRELFIRTDGIGRSKLSNNNLEKRLSVVGTTRNWNTVNQLLQLTAAR